MDFSKLAVIALAGGVGVCLLLTTASRGFSSRTQTSPSPRAPRRKLKGVVIGAGSRGMYAYAPLALENPEQEVEIIAIAEPNQARRQQFAATFNIPEENQFISHEILLERGRIADFAIVATPDLHHVKPALQCMALGYHVLLEKPMAPTEIDCLQLEAEARKRGVILQVCHVLRYSPLFARIKEIIDSGEIGEVVTIQHSENVSFWHFAHSFVRGLYRNSQQSSPLILAKSCHDLDLIYWFAGSAAPLRIASTARETLLTEKNKPEGAPLHCAEGCPHSRTCPYDATEMYPGLNPIWRDVGLTRHSNLAWFARAMAWVAQRYPSVLRAIYSRPHWPICQVTDDPTPEGVDHALRTTRWGRCVYQVGDNDQPSSQSVSMLFSNGVNASFTLHSTSHREGRETRIDGTLGSIRAVFYAMDHVIDIFTHKSQSIRRELPHVTPHGHGGADKRLFAGFLAAIRGETAPLTTAEQSLWSHRMCFAAEVSRRNAVVVSFDEHTGQTLQVATAAGVPHMF